MTHNKVVKHVGRKRPSSAGYEKRKKMTTEEFIEAVNAIDNRDEIKAYLAPDGTVSLSKCGYSLVAALRTDAIKWRFYGVDVTIPTKILKLMIELAESKEENNKYVILEISTRLFLANRGGNPSFCTTNLDDLANVSYTKEELEQLKSTLPKKLQDAVDLLTVTVSEAKKVLKNEY